MCNVYMYVCVCIYIYIYIYIYICEDAMESSGKRHAGDWSAIKAYYNILYYDI